MFHRKVGNGPKKSGEKTVYANSGFTGKMMPGNHAPSKIDKITIYHDKPRISFTVSSLFHLHDDADDVETKKYELTKLSHIRIALNVFSHDISAEEGWKTLVEQEGKDEAEQSVLGKLLMHYCFSHQTPLLDAPVRKCIKEFLDGPQAEKTRSAFASRL